MEQLQADPPSEDDSVRGRLKVIFSHYCQLGDKLNQSHIKTTQFQKLLADVGVKQNSKIDLIYKAVVGGNKKMTFEQFLDSLVKVAEFMFHEVVDDSSAALKGFLDHHLLPLYQKLAPPRPPLSKDKLTEQLVREVCPTLLLIYQVYYRSTELQNQENEKVIFDLMRDFELCPDACSKVTLFKLLQNSQHLYLEACLDCVIIKDANRINTLTDLKRLTGYNFTFFRFVDLLVQVACTAFNDTKLLQVEMLQLCLERMELSKGMRHIDRTNSFSPVTLIASKALQQKIKDAKPIELKPLCKP